MEERTFINSMDVHTLLMSLENCACYDSAKELLNAFVRDCTGKEYETEGGIKHYNSKNPSDIKQETLVVIDESISAFNDIDEASERGMVCGRKELESQGIMCDDGGVIAKFREMRRKRSKVAAYIDIWRKEPAIKIKGDIHRISPIGEHVKTIARKVFLFFVNTGYLKESDKNSWEYICNLNQISKVPPQIIWNSTLISFSVLTFLFLGNRKLFNNTHGARRNLFCKMFLQKDGSTISEDDLKGSLINAKANGTLNELKKNWFSHVPELKNFEPLEKQLKTT